jgi:hypothetical protein
MSFDTTEEQHDLREAACVLAASRLRPLAARRDAAGGFPYDALGALVERGFMGINVDADLGGLEAGVVAYSLIMIELGAADASVAVTTSVNNMVAEILAEFGTEAQRRSMVPRLTGGDWAAGSFCLSEPGSGSDASSMRTRARRTDDGWILDGQKAWITSGPQAGVFIVWAKTGDDEISAFVVDPDSEGISIGSPEEKMGQHASHTVSVAFEAVELPADALLGERGRGFAIAMTALDGGRIGVASMATGIAREAIELIRAVRPEGSVDAEFDTLFANLEAARLLALRAAWHKERGAKRFTRAASMAKLYASELATRAAETAVRRTDPATEEGRLAARLVRDARVTRIYEGTSEIQRLVIARTLRRQGIGGAHADCL